MEIIDGTSPEITWTRWVWSVRKREIVAEGEIEGTVRRITGVMMTGTLDVSPMYW